MRINWENVENISRLILFTGAKINLPRWLVNELNPLAKNQNILVFG